MHVYKGAIPHEQPAQTISFPSLPQSPSHFPFLSFALPLLSFSTMVRLLVTALAPFVVLATSVAADPSNHHRSAPLSLSITKHVNPFGSYCPVEEDRRRINHLSKKGNRTNATSNLKEPAGESINAQLNGTGLFYIAKVGVGIPATYRKSCVNFLSGI